MPIVEKLIKEVLHAQAVVAESFGLPEGACAIRNGISAKTCEVATAHVTDETIRKYFKDYEEVKAERAGDGDLYPEHVYGHCDEEHGRKVVTLLIRSKPAPEMRTVSRETLAVLAEHYEATPAKDAAGNAALTEAKEAL